MNIDTLNESDRLQDEHRAIYEAVRAGDRDLAAELTRRPHELLLRHMLGRPGGPPGSGRTTGGDPS